MPSLDIVNEIDMQQMDNAINSASREIQNRYDFKGSKSSIELNKKEKAIEVLADDEMKLNQLISIIQSKLVKQKIDPSVLDDSKEKHASGNMLRKVIHIKEGISKETAKKIVKSIKDTKLKVQPSIMDDTVRVTGKKIDDLRFVMETVRSMQLDIPVQFVNMKS